MEKWPVGKCEGCLFIEEEEKRKEKSGEERRVRKERMSKHRLLFETEETKQ